METFSPVTWQREGYVISTDAGKLDLATIHSFLTASYWAEGIPFETVKRSIQHSLCFGVYKTGASNGDQQVGFARVITDYATYAYLADVFVLEKHRGRGISRWLMECVTGHPELQGLRRWSLITRDAHGLYRKFAFAELVAPERWMERHTPAVYSRKA